MYFNFLSFGGGEIILVFLAVLLLFGADKIPELARMLGKGMNEFKKATDDLKREFNEETKDFQDDIKDSRRELDEHVREIKNNIQDVEKSDSSKERSSVDKAMKNNKSTDDKDLNLSK